MQNIANSNCKNVKNFDISARIKRFQFFLCWTKTKVWSEFENSNLFYFAYFGFKNGSKVQQKWKQASKFSMHFFWLKSIMTRKCILTLAGVCFASFVTINFLFPVSCSHSLSLPHVKRKLIRFLNFPVKISFINKIILTLGWFLCNGTPWRLHLFTFESWKWIFETSWFQ